MSAIGPGSRVKCIKRGAWETVCGCSRREPPMAGRIYTVTQVYEDHDGLWLSLVGWSLWEAFAACQFRPLDDDSEIERLRAILAHITDPDTRKIREPAEIEG
jgi:hypothetical protein